MQLIFREFGFEGRRKSQDFVAAGHFRGGLGGGGSAIGAREDVGNRRQELGRCDKGRSDRPRAEHRSDLSADPDISRNTSYAIAGRE